MTDYHSTPRGRVVAFAYERVSAERIARPSAASIAAHSLVFLADEAVDTGDFETAYVLLRGAAVCLRQHAEKDGSRGAWYNYNDVRQSAESLQPKAVAA